MLNEATIEGTMDSLSQKLSILLKDISLDDEFEIEEKEIQNFDENETLEAFAFSSTTTCVS